MSVSRELSNTAAATPLRTQAWTPAVCETMLSWIHTPPTAPLGWDAPAWEEARWAIAVHGVAPLLYKSLNGTPGWAFLAAETRHWLAEQYRMNDLRTRKLMDDLESVLASAHEAGIPVVPLKGSASLYTLYSDEPALRPMADIDVLVRPRDEKRFTELLLALGYVMEEVTPRHRSFAHPEAQQVVYTHGEHPDNPRGIQVHTEISEHFWGSRYDLTEALWEGSTTELGSAQAWLSSPVGRMQHLLVHGSADVVAGKVRLARFVDVARLAEQFDEAMWQRVVDAGMAQGEARWLFTSLYLVTRYIDAPIPASVLAQLERATPPALRRFLARATMYYLSFCNPVRVSLADRLTWHRVGRERVVALWHCMMPAPAHLRDYYPELAPSRALPLLYMHHWVLMADGVRRLLFRVPRRSWLQRANGGK